MNEYQKEVFSNPVLLREKLEIYLQTPKKVEIYAKACEKFFKAGNGEKLKFKLTWSWWALFGTFFFYIYRRDYKSALIVISIIYFLTLFFISMEKYLCLSQVVYGCYKSIINAYYISCLVVFLISAICAKYMISKRFLKILKTQDDEDLKLEGSPNKLAFYFLALMISINSGNSGRIFNLIF